MGMEQRGNNTYYYRKRWERGTCISDYLGNGDTAQLIAQCEQVRQAEEAAVRAAHRAARGVERAQIAEVRGVTRAVRQVLAAVLIANGYHQHKRQWRKAMHQDTPDVAQPETALVAPADPESDFKRGMHALRAALATEATPAKASGKVTERDRAIAERDKRAAVRRVLRDYPCIWGGLRVLLSSAEKSMIEATCGTRDSSAGMLIDHTLKAMRRELGYQDAPQLEQLLIENVVVAWLDLDCVQQQYVKHTYTSHTNSSGLYWDRRLNGAQARYLRATEALARVHRLAMPQPLQVNIGGQQVNVAGTMNGEQN